MFAVKSKKENTPAREVGTLVFNVRGARQCQIWIGQGLATRMWPLLHSDGRGYVLRHRKTHALTHVFCP